MKNIQAIRGMHDVLPDEIGYWKALERILFTIAEQYGYQEIRFPLIEFTELFSRSIGEGTDVVEKEMYTFVDRSSDSLTLRPEGTASCIRAGIEHGMLHNQIQRFFYYGPMFRHERPQKGRYRQFHQFGVEAYGMAGPAIDLEMILMAMRFWQDLGIEHKVILQINTLGDCDSRLEYRQHLVDYFYRNYGLLDGDGIRRLNSNPLRLLDSKNPRLKDVIDGAPKILDYLNSDSREHFDQLVSMLKQLEIPHVINPHLVRGLDYYNSTVFEWVVLDQKELSQNSICAGGHYDSLVANLGGRETSAIGFALGMERLLALVGEELSSPSCNLIYLVTLGKRAIVSGMQFVQDLRCKLGKKILVDCQGGDLKSQLRRANKSGAEIVLILGDNELDRGEIIVKYIKGAWEQRVVKLDELISGSYCI